MTNGTDVQTEAVSPGIVATLYNIPELSAIAWKVKLKLFLADGVPTVQVLMAPDVNVVNGIWSGVGPIGVDLLYY